MIGSMEYKKLRKLLYYNPFTGFFYWKVDCKKQLLNKRAGSPHPRGYRYIRKDNQAYSEHKLAFLYMEGCLPENDIDHIDGNPSNNKWSNLREVSKSCNMRNCKVGKNNRSGVTGVSLLKTGKWYAGIHYKGKDINLGRFKNFDDAVKSRWNAEVKYDWSTCNTTSSAYLHLKNNNLI